MRIQLSSAAQKDVAATREWYADQLASDLDLRFQRELEQVFEQMVDFPTGFPVALGDIRRANLHRFPYAVFYHTRPQLGGEVLYVLAVVHQARHPRVWKRRR